VPLLREAAFADSVSVVRSHFEPWRGLKPKPVTAGEEGGAAGV